MGYRAETLLRRSDTSGGVVVNRATVADVGWDFLNFEVRRFSKGQRWIHETGEHELALVLLGGQCEVVSSRGSWRRIGRRPNVFAGMPWALYLPRHTDYTLTALTDGCEVARGWVLTDQDHPPRLIRPRDCAVELRGGGDASRQITSIIPPGFGCDRLVCVEVYTPGGNWSSYPPHKHDVHRVDQQGELIEADLDEVYFYKFDKPGGWAFQRVYTAEGSIDEALLARSDDLVLVPEGYHPVSAAPGYGCYYLNFLAGTAQSLASAEDPAHGWIKGTWTGLDPRLPLVTLGMEPLEER